MVALLGLNSDDLAVGDNVTFGFRNVTTPSGAFDSGKAQNIPLACESKLAGTFTYSTVNYFCPGDELTGTAEWTEVGAGRYTSDDFAYGIIKSATEVLPQVGVP